jgi:hypothetical protein
VPSGWPAAPSGEMPTSAFERLRPVPSSRGPRLRNIPNIPLVPVITGVLVLVVIVAVLALHDGGNSAAPTGAAATPFATASAESAASPSARRQAAVRLSGLLAQSVSDRAAVVTAVTDVRDCGGSLRQDTQTFTAAASSRQRLLSRLTSMPGRSLLSAAMISDLIGAWQASAQADNDLARWADDEASRRCSPRTSGSDGNLEASYTPDGEATASKKAFAGLWNPVATRYGLTTYQWDQL